MMIKRLCEKYLEKHEDSLSVFLRSIYLFKDFTEHEIDNFQSEVAFSQREYAKNEIIVQEDQIGHSMFIVYKGSIKISVNNNDKVTVVADNLSSGHVFGEIALLNKNLKRTATVKAKEPTTLFAINSGDLDKLKKLPKISAKFYKNLSEKLSEDIINTNNTLKIKENEIKKLESLIVKCNRDKEILEQKIEKLSLKLDKFIKTYEK